MTKLCFAREEEDACEAQRREIVAECGQAPAESEKAMKREAIREGSDLLKQVEEIDRACDLLNKQDADQFGSRCFGYSMREYGPLLSADAARRIRAIMREDFQSARRTAITRLTELGVEELPTNTDFPITPDGADVTLNP